MISKETKARVNFAVSVMLRGGNTTRNFDGCFENDDNRQVASLVYRRALKNPRLMKVFPRYLCLESCRADYEREYPDAQRTADNICGGDRMTGERLAAIEERVAVIEQQRQAFPHDHITNETVLALVAEVRRLHTLTDDAGQTLVEAARETAGLHIAVADLTRENERLQARVTELEAFFGETLDMWTAADLALAGVRGVIRRAIDPDYQ